MEKPTPLEAAYGTVVAFLSKVRRVNRTNTKEWDAFTASLEALTPALRRTVSVWTMENLEHHRPELVRPRVLHESEANFVGKEAHGLLLEAMRVGMISPGQAESILEEIVDLEATEADSAYMRATLARIWSHNIRNYQKIQLN